jgi:D-arabinose 5-phosphate isomerase GutQ
MKALGMRLMHLGLKTEIVGDMTAAPIGKGNLRVISPGNFEPF